MIRILLEALVQHALELVGLTLELVVLFAILREVRELKLHHAALRRHEEHLTAARPLMSTLYSGDEECMALAVAFTEQASSICALGAISTLLQTERCIDETAADHNVRLSSLAPNKLAYVTATLQAITRGCRYRRIMDFSPRDSSAGYLSELLANVNFFIRAYDTPRAIPIDLKLYHSNNLMIDRGDFHFRVSDRQLVLRVGGHGNGYANAALLLTDTRVIDEYRHYFESLVASPATQPISYEDLQRLKNLLIAGDIAGAMNIFQPTKPEQLVQRSSPEVQETFAGRSWAQPSGESLRIVESAVVMAAGRGTRMGPLTHDHQKCMLPIGNKPLLGWILSALVRQGVSRIFVLAGYRSEDVDQYVKNQRLSQRIEVVRVTPSSTAAALAEVRSSLSDHFWYVHGNILFPTGILSNLESRYLDFHASRQRYASAILCTVSPKTGLTHAILRRQSSGKASMHFAMTGTEPRPVADPRSDVLSLGLGIMNKAELAWHKPMKESLMTEGLIEPTPEHPLLYVPIRKYLHIETHEDYERLKDNMRLVRGITHE